MAAVQTAMKGGDKMKVRGIRGAITAEENSPQAIYAATADLMQAIVEQNQLDVDDIASVWLTMSSDLNADFPARAVRSRPGWEWVPLMCAVEVDVPGSVRRCIRVLIHVNTSLAQTALRHIYLGEATVLRPDLAESAGATPGAT